MSVDDAKSLGRRMSQAAQVFMSSLSDDQAGAAAFAWNDDERCRWYYTPTDHGGLPLFAMTSAQQQFAMRLLATGLSTAGYVTASTIMGLENVLDHLEGWTVGWGRERGRDPQHYYLSVFGEPDGAAPWSWRFGGHHLSVQHVVHGDEVLASTPCFFGADPAEVPLLGGHLLRPLGACEDLARDLVRSLNDSQALRARLDSVAPVDIVSANRATVADGDTVLPLGDVWRSRFEDLELSELVDGMHARAERKAGITAEHLQAVAYTTKPKGLAANEMSEAQRDQLSAVMRVFIDRLPDDLANREHERTAGDKLLDVSFAWAGSTERGAPHYYRMQGPGLLAEYDNTQRDVNHIHTVWRNPDNDFGNDVLRQHLAVHHQGQCRSTDTR